jgi:hypothetical protein
MDSPPDDTEDLLSALRKRLLLGIAWFALDGVLNWCYMAQGNLEAAARNIREGHGA